MSRHEDNLIRLYLEEAGQHPSLTQTEAVELCRLARADRRARMTLAKRNQGLIVSTVASHLGYGLGAPDLLGRANLMFGTATQAYSESKGAFEIYVRNYLRDGLEQVLWEESDFSRDAPRIHLLRERLYSELRNGQKERSDTLVNEFAKLLDVPEWQVRFLLEAQGRSISSEKELLAAIEFPCMHKRAKDFARRVEALMMREREKRLFLARYGLDDSFQTRTAKKLSRMFGVAEENIEALIDSVWLEINPHFLRVQLLASSEIVSPDISFEKAVKTFQPSKSNENVVDTSRAQYLAPEGNGVEKVPALLPIPGMLLPLVSEAEEVSVSLMLGSSRKEVHTHARHLAMYLLHEDFVGWSFDRVSEVFGKYDGTASFNAYKRISRELGEDQVLREIVIKIRSCYTISIYSSVLQLEESQSKLFPKQLEEVRFLLKERTLRRDRFLELVASVVEAERSRRMFKMLYGLDEERTRHTLEQVGQYFGGLTRERIRQLAGVVWKKIKESALADIESADELIDLLNEISTLEKLISAS